MALVKVLLKIRRSQQTTAYIQTARPAGAVVSDTLRS